MWQHMEESVGAEYTQGSRFFNDGLLVPDGRGEVIMRDGAWIVYGSLKHVFL
jgi:hypothetical protein